MAQIDADTVFNNVDLACESGCHRSGRRGGWWEFRHGSACTSHQDEFWPQVRLLITERKMNQRPVGNVEIPPTKEKI